MIDSSVRVALESLAKAAGCRQQHRYTHFLDPAQAEEAGRIARAYGLLFCAWGGFAQAERKIGCFLPPGEAVTESDYPICALMARYDARFATLTHRDVLGATLALGLTRAVLGDIITESGRVFLFVEKSLAPFLEDGLREIGRTTLRFSFEPDPQALLPAPAGSYFRAVIPSLRLDAVLAAAYHLSRSRAGELIRGGGVKVNYLPCLSVDKLLSADCMLSVRGLGRVRLASMDGQTRKERLGVTFFKYE